MNANPADNSDTLHGRTRFRFSLLSLLLVMTLACMALAWLLLHPKSDIVALLQVSPSSTPFDILQSTHLALLKSTATIQAVLSDPQISNLPLIKDQADPASWLMQSLAVSFLQKSEILELRINVPARYSGQGQAVLGRLIEEYLAAATKADPTQKIKLIQPPVITGGSL
jgi:uncharacterized membrane protein AbrB (regulator of aidB expression)